MSASIRAGWLVSLFILAACSSGQSSNNPGNGGAPPAGTPATGGNAVGGAGGATAGGVSTGGTTGGVATGGSGCVTPQALCDGACVDTSNSTSHCGMCGKGCLAAEQCSSGMCKCQNGPSGAPLTSCTNGCTDTASDNANCGACGTVCPTSQVCSQGKCGTMCAATETACSTGCVETAGMQQNPLHCGTCGNACAAGRVCLTGSCQCATGTTLCEGECVDTKTTEAHCGACGNACNSGQSCENGTCMGGTGGAGGTGGTGGTAGGGAGGTTGGGGGGGVSGGGNGGSSGSGSCEQGSTTTQWATTCRTTKATCTAGTWSSWGSSSPENYPLKHETEHFAFLWPDDRNVTLDAVKAAGQYMEDVLWKNYLGSPIFWPEPYCNTANKLKTSVHIIQDGLYGGCNNGRPGIWVGPGAMADHWGLGHEWTHALQCMSPGFADCGGNGCWIAESHANFMPHQLPEYRTGNNGTHCSEMLANEPHLYYGSTRDRYCNWQFFEFLKDKHCYEAVNEMWTETAPNGQRDPWNKLALNMGWNAEQLNDLFGEWAMHNITWDYKNPPPTDGSNQGTYYRQQYGSITSTTVNNNTHRRHRLTRLEPLDTSYAQNHRFVSPYYWAPQRWGYNVVRLFPTSGSKTVTVKFRGVTQAAANSGWRWGLVATDANITTPRYSPIKSGSDGELTFCVNAGESLFLVVVGAPTQIQKVVWDQAYPTIYRYPYMVELTGAWPEGFQNGAPDACPSGTQRHSNGGGCAPSNLSTNVYVGPYAQVLGGNVSGNARIEDQAVILSGATVNGGTVGALSTLYRFTVSDTAKVQTTFYPPGFFESGQGLSGTARLFGDVEYRGGNLNRNSGSFYGFVDNATASATINDVTVAPPYTWRN